MENILDSRNLEDRINELEAMREGLEEDDSLDEFDREELEDLIRARDEIGLEIWESGVILIHEGYFPDYTKQTAVETGAIHSAYDWPYNHIDWEEAAGELVQDYSQVTIYGDTYYWRG